MKVAASRENDKNGPTPEEILQQVTTTLTGTDPLRAIPGSSRVLAGRWVTNPTIGYRKGNEGSNPSPSTNKSEVQRNPPGLL